MQYAVPQFIDVENKIIGPISVRQFVLMVVALGLIFVAFKVADFALFIFITVIIVIFTAIFGFVKVNGRLFHYFILSLFQSMQNPHLRVWKKEAQLRALRKAKKKETKKEVEINYIKVVGEKEKSRSRLSELSLLVDTGGMYERKA